MKSNESKLIANSNKRLLTAYGFRLLNRAIEKAAKANNTNRYKKEFEPIKTKLTESFNSMVFDLKMPETEIIKFMNSIKIEAQKIEAPKGTITISL